MSERIPPLDSLAHNEAQLESFLCLLLEPSETLRSKLVPDLLESLQDQPPSSYTEVVDVAQNIVRRWKVEYREDLISGHPLIGEVQGLSGLSSREQGNHKPTPESVLFRLKHLNALYSKIYAGLPYITFVAGRSREAIAGEMESHIGVTPAHRPLDAANGDLDEPPIMSDEVDRMMVPRLSEAWTKELDRALNDMWKIAVARLKGLEIQL